MPWVGAGIPEVADADWTEWALAAQFRDSSFLYPIRDNVLNNRRTNPDYGAPVRRWLEACAAR